MDTVVKLHATLFLNFDTTVTSERYKNIIGRHFNPPKRLETLNAFSRINLLGFGFVPNGLKHL